MLEGNYHHVKTVRKVIGQTHMGQSSRLIEVTAINVCKCVFLLSLFNPVSSYESHVRMIRRVSRFLCNNWYSYCTCLAMTVIHTYIQMQRLKWHCHSTVAGALYKIIASNSCSAVFRHRTHETVSSSVPGGTAATMERPWQTTAGHSRHVPLPPGRCGHQVWRVALAARPVSTWQQTGVADVHQRQQTSEGSQRGMKVQ